MFFLNPNFYYISIGLQVICVYHCIRKGNQNKWIWLIVFLPMVGCLIYFFTEIFTNREMSRLQSGFGELVNPSGSIKKLEENLRFSDTFNNRVALADAYLHSGNTDKAIDLYEQSLKGAFDENEHVLSQLVVAYNEKKLYEQVIATAQKLYALPQFRFSHIHVLYANALAQVGLKEKAEAELKSMNSKYSHYEARVTYGKFLQQQDREEEAHAIFANIALEAKHLSSRERRYYRNWLLQAKEELKKIETVSR